MPNEPEGYERSDVGPRKVSGGTQATDTTTPQRLRIHVPTANAELVLGLNDDGHLGIRAITSGEVTRRAELLGGTILDDDGVIARSQFSLGLTPRGFVGALTTVDHGNVYIGANGAVYLGTEYHHAQRVQAIVEGGITLIRTGLAYWSARYQGGGISKLQAALGAIKVTLTTVNAVASPLAGGIYGGAMNFDYLKTGHVSVFGARTVGLHSLETVSSGAALLNSHSGGLAASLNSVVSASVNSGLLASVNAGFSASLNAQTASVVGQMDAGVASRVGVARLEGLSVRIGTRKQAGLVATYLSGLQDPTRDVWVRADDYAEMGVTSILEPFETPLDWVKDGHLIGQLRHPTGLQVMTRIARLSTSRSALRVTDESVTSLSGRSVLRVGSSGIELGRAAAPVAMTTGAALSAARLGYNTAWGLADGLIKQAKGAVGASAVATATGVVGTIAAFAATAAPVVALAGVGAAAGAGAGGFAGGKEGEGGSENGAKIGAIAGGVIGGLGAFAAMTMIALKAAGQAQRAAKTAAFKAYTAAVTSALTAEALAATIIPPGGKVTIDDSGVTITAGAPVGGSSIKITATGIEITGLSITVNDMKLGPPMIPKPQKPPRPSPEMIAAMKAPTVSAEMSVPPGVV